MNEREDFHFDLGVDHQIRVDYKVNKEFVSESGFLKKRTKMVFHQIIEVENKNLYDIKLKILDNYPKPNKKDSVKV